MPQDGFGLIARTRVKAMTPTIRKIAVATVTRGRPLMLSRLLASYERIKVPEGIQLCFLIVENNDEKTLLPVIRNFRNRLLHQVTYILEPVLGIAAARNRAIEHAISDGFDLLTFADDDEEVDSDWLFELLKERDAGDLDIVGSPVRLAPVGEECSQWNKTVWKAVNDINLRAEQRCIKRKAQGRAGNIRLATGSWMGKLEFFKRTGLRFNEELGLGGGEDWQMYDVAKRLGARTGWTPYAVAYESLPRTRLCLSYYYRRNRDHARMVFRERYKEDPIGSLIRLSGSLASRFYKFVLATLRFPFRPGNSMLACTYHIGSSVGLIQGMVGKKSEHYASIDGS
ncbi:glycosyltransferase family 2 protein [Brucella intermedia]|uniref:glycosyltransferase family 2 protein n=1 Tax=Brucella intermedia TaxID=94625 RepID=UPI00224AFE65|nr:glycosyltransferase family 2 protein [Brucella intermedia]